VVAFYRLLLITLCALFAAAAGLMMSVWMSVPAFGQSSDAAVPPVATIFIDGRPVRTESTSDADSLHARAADAVDSLHQAGFLSARIDSVALDVGGPSARITRGPRTEVGAIELVGIDEQRRRELLDAVRLGVGSAFTPLELEEDIRRILSYLANEGRYLARVSVDQIRPMATGDTRLAITLRVDQGPVLPLKRIDLVGGRRTKPGLVSRVTGLAVGEPLRHFEPEALQRTLFDARLFEDVGLPELVVEADSGVVLRIPVDEGDPGAFDIVLGYLPPTVDGERGRVIGSGHLLLQNPFGAGRSLSVRLDRLPGQASRIDVEVSSPFLLGLPLGVAGGFSGLSQDSTYGKQRYGGQVRYYVAGGFDLIGSFSREVTSPGQTGLELSASGRQIIPGAEAWFVGLGVSLRRIDRPRNPRRGLAVEMNLESGRKRRSERRLSGTDTTRTTTSFEQQRLQARVRAYLPTLSRQVLVIGGDAGLLVSNEYDRSDLFRFGGATSLRGYDEDRFLGRLVGRALVEYRLLIDRYSFAYAFFDLGYVDRPATPDITASTDLHPGYGVGFQYETAIGLVNVSAALNPEGGPTDARIHAGLSFGL